MNEKETEEMHEINQMFHLKRGGAMPVRVVPKDA